MVKYIKIFSKFYFDIFVNYLIILIYILSYCMEILKRQRSEKFTSLYAEGDFVRY